MVGTKRGKVSKNIQVFIQISMAVSHVLLYKDLQFILKNRRISKLLLLYCWKKIYAGVGNFPLTSFAPLCFFHSTEQWVA